MTDTNPTTPSPDETDDTTSKPIDLGDGWIEKDGDVIEKDVDEVLPQAKPSEGQAPLP